MTFRLPESQLLREHNSKQAVVDFLRMYHHLPRKLLERACINFLCYSHSVLMVILVIHTIRVLEVPRDTMSNIAYYFS